MMLPMFYDASGIVSQELYLARLHSWLDGFNRHGCGTMLRPLKTTAKRCSSEGLKMLVLLAIREPLCKN